MEETKKAFRAVYKEYAKHYLSGEIDKVPNLEGRRYIKDPDKRCNNFDYDPEKRYLHFYPSLHDAEEYAKMLRKEGIEKGKPRRVVVLKFELPKELTDKVYYGRYFSFVEMRDVDREEYIFEADKYDNSFCKGEAGDGDREKNRVYYDPDSYGWF